MIEFMFFTDCEIPKVVYENTTFIKTSFADYCLRVSKALDINFSPSNAYKLCDLRPFYGIIHKDELRDYKYWGYGDIDLIYGDLNLVLTKSRLKYYDLITTHDDRVAGHLTIIRKESKISTICYKIKDYQSKLEDVSHRALDEDDFSYLVYPQLKTLERIYRYLIKPFGIWHKRYFKLINPIFCNRLTKISFVEYYTTEIPKETEEWQYSIKEGKITKLPQQLELPYLHFLFFKKTPYLITEKYWHANYYNVDNLDSAILRGQTICISLNGINICNK